jgi:hypothetical protein
MGDYRSRAHAHEFEPTIDWRALFVLSTLLSAASCAALLILAGI